MDSEPSIDRRTLSRRAVADLLDDLDAARPLAPTGNWTLLLPPGKGLADAGAPAARSLPAGIVAAADESGTGAAVFWSEQGGLAILPPFPLEGDGLMPGWTTASLRSLFAREYLLGVVLLRLEGYAVGVFQGDRLLDSRTGSRWIHGRNRKGGQSQRRFERTREKHIQELFDDACQAAQDKFTPHGSRIDYVALGGDRHTLQAFLKGCRFLERYASRILPQVLSIVEPKRATLERLPYALWQSQVLSWTAGTGNEEQGTRNEP